MQVTVNGKGIGIEHFPDRKNASLTVIEGNTHTVVGHLKSQSAEILFKAVLTEMVDMIAKGSYAKGWEDAQDD